MSHHAEDKKEFTIEEAATYLNKSVRTIERWKLPHKLQTRRGKDYIDREVRIFSKEILDEAMKPKDATKHIPGVSVTDKRQSNVADMSQAVSRKDLLEFAEKLVTSFNVGFENQTKLLAPMADADKKKLDLTLIANKLLLTKREALTLSGLTEKELHHALEQKTITGRKTSEKGTWKINRLSLEKYVELNF